MPTYDWLNFGNHGQQAPTATADEEGDGGYVRDGYATPGQRPTFADAGSGLFRKEGKEWWKDVAGDILDFGSGYVDWLSAEEERRGQASEDILRSASAKFDKPSMTDADIQRQFGAGADEAARGYNANLKDLRTAMGGAGVTGGARAQGQAVNFAAQMNRVLVDTRKSLYEKRVQTDMMDRAQKFSAEVALAAQVGRDPSVATMDWLGTGANTAMGLYGIEAGQNAAKKLANAQEKAGWASAIGNAIPGLGSILG